MNKSELIAAVAEKTGQQKADVTAILDALQATVVEGVASGDKITLPGFLTFEKAHRAARTGKNPATGEELKIAAADVPKVKIGKAFKDAVAG